MMIGIQPKMLDLDPESMDHAMEYFCKNVAVKIMSKKMLKNDKKCYPFSGQGCPAGD
jgi:hypothetical protein